MIAIDIETVDPNLKDLGDGSIRKDGSIVCVGLYDGTNGIVVTPDDIRLKDWLASDEDKIFHNGVYDLSWLVCCYGFDVNGKIHDTMTRAAMINEYQDLDLDSCCKLVGIQGKNYAITLEAYANELGISKKNIFNLLDVIYNTEKGKEIVDDYCLQDCKSTYNLFLKQAFNTRELGEAYDLECQLYPIVLEMKRNGILIDSCAKNKLTEELLTEILGIEQELSKYNLSKDIIRSPKQLSVAMNSMGIYSPIKTEKGSESWSTEALEMLKDEPCAEVIRRYKIYDAVLSKYLQSSFVDCIFNNRIHCTFSPNKRIDGGTITGRFASSKPNLQNIPAKDEIHGIQAFGQRMRSLFLPDEGCMLGAFDYSAIETRVLAHYAVGEKADWFREAINNGQDLHTIVQDLTGITNRMAVKKMNFAFIYGMSPDNLLRENKAMFEKAASEQNMSMEKYAQGVFNAYATKFPIVNDTMQYAIEKGKNIGFIESIGNRVHHRPKPELNKYGTYSIKYYKMLNYLIQGSAADILKKGMVTAWDDGCFNVCKLHLTVHDEIVMSIPYNNIGVEAAMHIKYCMENAYNDRLKVKLPVNCEVGPNWGYWSDDIWREMCERKFTRKFTRHCN